MKTSASSPLPALEVPGVRNVLGAEVPEVEGVLDGVIAALGVAVESIGLDQLSRLPAQSVLSILSKTAALGRGVDAILAAAANEVAVRSDPVLGSEGLAARLNYARASHLVEQVTGMSAAAAARLIRVGARTSPRVRVGQPLPALFPVVKNALQGGLIGIETADVITKELATAAPRADVDHLTAAEQVLVGQATGQTDSHGMALPTDLVAIQARQWRDRLDGDGIEPRAEKAFQNRDFWISRRVRNGVMKFGGQVTPDVGGKLHALLDAVLSPRTTARYQTSTEPGDVTAPDGVSDADETTESPEPGRMRDPRTPGQQRADVFAAMIDSLARSTDTPTVSGASPTVIVRVDADVLTTHTGTGQIVGIPDPIPSSAIRQILCDSSTIPIYLKPDGGIAAIGTEKRTFNRTQRAGMIARDGPTCAIPDCQIPATACEAHHITEHHNGGPTHLDNGILLCWFHHHMVDTGTFTITITNGKPVIHVPDWLTRRPYFH